MFLKLICFVAPLSIAFPINIGSKVFAAEIVIPCFALIIFLSKGKIQINHEINMIIRLISVYIASQIFSDLWNGSDYDQYSRGWARVFLFFVNIISIYIVIDSKRSHLILFSLGFALGRIWITYSGFEGDIVPWKIGLAKPVALLAIVACVATSGLRGSHAYLAAILLLALGIFDIVMDFRSHGAILIIVAVLLMSSSFLRKWLGNHRVGGFNSILSVSVASMIAVLAAYQIYVYAAESGWLSENAHRKYEAQVRQVDLPLLVAGRSETLVYFEAIFGSIIIGHGSWPRNQYYAEQLATARVERGLSKSSVQSADNSIPIHSHIFGSWIEAGILGGLFWLNIVILILKSMIKSSIGTSHMRPLYLYGAVLLLWDIFFSPFSGFRRLETAFLIVIVLRSLLQRQAPSKLSAKRARRRKRKTRRLSTENKSNGNDVVRAN